MKKKLLLLILPFLLGACDIWDVNPQPFPVWTPIPSGTPSVITPTPIILAPVTVPPAVPSDTPVPSPTVAPSFTPAPTETFTAVPAPAIAVEILGCNTSVDVTHGMGEVTNAYVVLKNVGNVDLPNTCALLRAIDEGREHPDRQVCLANLPVAHQATLKLTVDSTYKQGTVIQVDASSNGVLLLRVDKHSCADIGLFGGAPSDLGVVQPIQ